MATEYDVVILGGGTGGYVAAIRAAQLGLKTAVVEKEKLGGTCLHKGCIPSKALLRSAEVYRTAREADQFGVETAGVSLNFEKVQQRKQAVVDKLAAGVNHLMKKGKIDVYTGYGRILGPSIFSPLPGTISVERGNGEENDMLIPKQVIIATGSRPRMLPGLEVDGKSVLTSDEALQMEELPQSIIIVGGGVIGIEWASMLHDFGVKVTVIEYADRILPTEDLEISKEMESLLKKKGIQFITGAKVLPDTMTKTSDDISIQAEKDGETVTYSAEKMLVSIGRQANIEGIGLENTDIVTENGMISVNESCQTKESHIYAIGDVIGGLQLAHVASHEGIIAVEHFAGLNPHPLDPTLVPKCIYSSPEAASVGLTEDEAKANGHNVKIGKFPFMAIGKALVYGESDGFVKIVADRDTDDILGVHMIGPHVTDMISEAGLAKVLDATPWEVGQTIHPHPTLSEAIGEAALAADGKAIHF
ncbi:dihydrolipoyl dehydrogenase [Bacillus subtilis subsp. subtilis]|uniref:Dihydrolipoyl dehydrogenase n=5 Tax=Bacillus subtilis TaxID=1423 RepID=DLDH2_BACSU|nr:MULTISPECIES: dihydrolipoyl dehydrogenase [Bacillales]NP_390286.2 branched-chain alpha-keto acid dehydrogenase E3 subunit (dihydrolipoamide dehydrogenase) [Bacillus subtilis subsp. subtilis str. 168]P54533.1 RecName: Full=Dihydrolipoyl dehydrogenase; AltName: Full=Dihydrolipoamide dehydrogenase; AltName: Full=E3 component of branched-chain alpha-keto acid dehydrogenase complex; AltName: Full=LPD-Val [Bacillus subtilis subsp. subtilis str. 168]AGC24038.1 dihydrolipoamide dehydrogenase [synthet